MNKFLASLVLFVAYYQTSAQYISDGELCSGIGGPVGDCFPSSTCCETFTDLSLCVSGEFCPEKYIEEGGLCSGIAGPLPLPCFPGTTCCFVNPDDSQCLRRCKKA